MPTPPDETTVSLFATLRSNLFAGLEALHANCAPADAAARYHTLLRHAYWKAHDLPAVVAVARAGIAWCLARSLEPGTPADIVKALRSEAKHIAYDAGSFTWPGWEEPGIAPTEGELAFGRECAVLNLRLAIELHRPAEGVSRAHWLIGAHALAAGDAGAAEEHFARAQSVIAPAEPAARDMHPLNAAYQAVARLVGNPADAGARQAFDAVVAQFSARADADAAVFRQQLLAARRLFTRTPAAAG